MKSIFLPGMQIANTILGGLIMKYMLYIIGFIEVIFWITCFYLSTP